MATISNAITMQDRMTPVFNSMIKAMHSTLNIMKKVDAASNKGISAKAWEKVSKDIQKANNAVLKFSNSTNIANGEGIRLSNTFNRLGSIGLNLLGIQSLISGIGQANQLLSKTMEYFDNITLLKARLDLVNDGLQTTEKIQENIFNAANRARTSYDGMAKSVAKLNMLAADQFATNDEAIYFMETLNKIFAVSGTGAEEASAAMYQLTQAMGSGVLQGDEFRSIMENAPMLIQKIAESLGVTRGELKAMSSDGKITAGVIKKAMFDAAEDINKQFESLPKTWGQLSQIAKNHIQKAFEPLAGQISTWLQTDSAKAFFDAIVVGATVAAQVFSVAIDLITGTLSFLHEVFIAMLPALHVFGIFLLAIGIAYLPTIISALWGLLPGLWATVSALWAKASALIASAVAWMILNWQITLVIIVLAILIGAIMATGVTFGDVIGFIVGLFYLLFAVVANVAIAIINALIIVATFLYNIFINPIGAVKMLFYDMAAFAVDQILWIAKALQDLVNMIPGVNIPITAGLEDVKAKILAAKAEVAKETGVKEAKTIKPLDVGKQTSKGFNIGKNFTNSFSSGGIKNPPGMSSVTPSISGIGAAGKPKKVNSNPTGGKLDKVGKIEDDIKITDEDIKLLKDIATTKFVNQYTTLRPEMNVTFGDIHENADVDKILSTIEDMAEEALANAIIEEV